VRHTKEFNIDLLSGAVGGGVVVALFGKQDMQIGLNFTAATPNQDRTSWIFMNAMNAINVFPREGSR
jgi:hypothetical protein